MLCCLLTSWPIHAMSYTMVPVCVPFQCMVILAAKLCTRIRGFKISDLFHCPTEILLEICLNDLYDRQRLYNVFLGTVRWHISCSSFFGGMSIGDGMVPYWIYATMTIPANNKLGFSVRETKESMPLGTEITIFGNFFV